MSKFLSGKLYVLLIVLALFLGSCGDDEPTTGNEVGLEGFFIVNEGGFGNGNTSISFFDREAETASNNLFSTANGIPLGDQAQSMTLHDDKGFIVVQNSGKIEVVDEDEFTIISTITEGIISPRYFVGHSAIKGYVSDWGVDGVSGTVKVIDLRTYEVTKTIDTGQGTNELIIQGDNLYAVNSGGFGRADELVIIDTQTDEISNTITITDNPNSLRIDNEGNIWIATSGHTAFDPDTFEVIETESTTGAIVKVSQSGQVLQTLSVDEVGFSKSPGRLNINNAGDQVYYSYSGAIYSMSINATELPAAPFINKSFYGFSVDPTDNTIIGCVAPDFSSSGDIEIYSEAGSLLTTYTVGIGPNGCTFK